MSPTSSSRARSRREVSLIAVDIFSPENRDGPDLARLVSFLNGFFPSVKVRVREPIASLAKKKDIGAFATRLASARVKDIASADQSTEPMFGEVDYEERAIAGEARVGGIAYDGRRLEEIFADIIGGRQGLETAHIVLTDRLVSTFSRDDLRHHLRTVVFDFPSIISIPGIVEAPAKPREYYVAKQQMGGAEDERIKAALKGRFIDFDDSLAIANVVQGLALQCMMYHLTLDPFCEDKDCRFFNAHWQEDLIRTQIRSRKICSRHRKVLSQLAEKPVLRW